MDWRGGVSVPGALLAGTNPSRHGAGRGAGDGNHRPMPGQKGRSAAASRPGGSGDHGNGAGHGSALESAASDLGLSRPARPFSGADLPAVFRPVAAAVRRADGAVPSAHIKKAAGFRQPFIHSISAAFPDGIRSSLR